MPPPPQPAGQQGHLGSRRGAGLRLHNRAGGTLGSQQGLCSGACHLPRILQVGSKAGSRLRDDLQGLQAGPAGHSKMSKAACRVVKDAARWRWYTEGRL